MIPVLPVPSASTPPTTTIDVPVALPNVNFCVFSPVSAKIISPPPVKVSAVILSAILTKESLVFSGTDNAV